MTAADTAYSCRRLTLAAARDTALGRGGPRFPCDRSSVPCDEGSPAVHDPGAKVARLPRSARVISERE